MESNTPPLSAGANNGPPPPSSAPSIPLNISFITPQGFSIQREVLSSHRVFDVLAEVASVAELSVHDVDAFFDGFPLDPMGDFNSTQPGEDGIVFIEICTKDQGQSLRIDDEGDMENALPPRAEFEKFSGKKPFLGGFRHKKTGVLYHHASSQTEMSEAKKAALLKKRQRVLYHREAQTVTRRMNKTQTQREQSTQMVRKGVMPNCDQDVEITPRPYVEANEVLATRWQKAVTLQRYARGMLARLRARQMRQAQLAEIAELELSHERAAEEHEANRKREMMRRMHPKSKKDFEILHTELEAWRIKETRRIETEAPSEDARKAELAQLLHKEAALLQTIDRLKTTANVENKHDAVEKKLKLMAAPKKWMMSDGVVAEVETAYTTRAKELYDLYRGLLVPLLTVDERLDVLLHIKWTVKEFDCVLTRDIVQLVDREADLLNRGRSEASVKGLRKRLASLFLEFCETPEFNPEAARFKQVPQTMLKNRS